jgi:DNA (cytosine-5)-methyltransferase 1
MTYYNEHDPKAAAWLRELIAEGHIANGHVDERSISDVKPSELSGYTQCHFFAGIGGWSLALRLAGWPDNRHVWTGSCPCQPFSSAGKAKGTADERHLWPDFKWIIEQCRPSVVFGEQVASKDGRQWLAGVFADLEGMDYQRAGADLCAAGLGAPHIRQRLYWLAVACGERCEAGSVEESKHEGGDPFTESGSGSGWLADMRGARLAKRGECEGVDELAATVGGGVACRMGDSKSRGCGVLWDASLPRNSGHSIGASWSRFEVIPCRDGKSRRIESGTFPLAHGIPGRVGLLRGYGNAIVPQVAAEFIMAAMDCFNSTN